MTSTFVTVINVLVTTNLKTKIMSNKSFDQLFAERDAIDQQLKSEQFRKDAVQKVITLIDMYNIKTNELRSVLQTRSKSSKKAQTANPAA